MRRIFLIVSVWSLLLVLTACGGEEIAVVPTVFELPTETPTLPVTVASTPTEAAQIVATEAVAASETATIEVTSSVTFTPSLTITDTPTRTATPGPTDTLVPGALNDFAIFALTAGPTFTARPFQYTGPPINLLGTIIAPGPGIGGPPGGPTAPPLINTPAPVLCQYPPPGGFGTYFQGDPAIAELLGCPVGVPPAPRTLAAATQNFERGSMVWLDTQPAPQIYVFYSNGTYERYVDTYDATVDPLSGGELPPPNLFEPVRGFGKLWRNTPQIRQGLGWALSAESGGNATLLDFERGEMISIPSRGDILALNDKASVSGGVWRAWPGSY